MVKNLPSNAGDVDLIPSQGAKILHAVGQLNPSTTTREPVHCNQGPAQPNFKKKKKKRHAFPDLSYFLCKPLCRGVISFRMPRE